MLGDLWRKLVPDGKSNKSSEEEVAELQNYLKWIGKVCDDWQCGHIGHDQFTMIAYSALREFKGISGEVWDNSEEIARLQVKAITQVMKRLMTVFEAIEILDQQNCPRAFTSEDRANAIRIVCQREP